MTGLETIVQRYLVRSEGEGIVLGPTDPAESGETRLLHAERQLREDLLRRRRSHGLWVALLGLLAFGLALVGAVTRETLFAIPMVVAGGVSGVAGAWTHGNVRTVELLLAVLQAPNPDPRDRRRTIKALLEAGCLR